MVPETAKHYDSNSITKMQETKDLVLLTSTFPYGTGESFLEEEIKVLSRRFSRVVILSLAPPSLPLKYEVPNNVEVIRVQRHKVELGCLCRAIFSAVTRVDCWKELFFVRKRFGYSLKSLAIIAGYVFTEKILTPYLMQYDVRRTIFYSYWTSRLAYALACFKQKRPGAFCFSRAHGYDNFIERKRSLFRRLIVDRLDAIYPISLIGKKEFEEKIFPHCPGRKPKVQVFHLGVDFPSQEPRVDSESRVFKIASCSFIYQLKRLDIIIDALSQIDDFPIDWIHFGDGEDEESIKNLAVEKLGAKKNIKFTFAGLTKHDDVLRYYEENHIDLFVNCSDLEGIPVSIMEAMARGIPCVARNVGGIAELLDDGKCGYLLNKDAGGSDFARVFRQFGKCSDVERKTFRSKAREKIEREFSSPKVYDAFIDDILESFGKVRQ